MPQKRSAILLSLLAVMITLPSWGKAPQQERVGSGFRFVLQAKPNTLPAQQQKRAELLKETVRVLQQRAMRIPGVTNLVVTVSKNDTITVELSGVTNGVTAVKQLTADTRLEFYPLLNVQSQRNPSAKWALYKDEKDPKTGLDIYSFMNTKNHTIIKGNSNAAWLKIRQKVVNAYDPVTNPNGVKPLLTGDDLLPRSMGDIDTQVGGAIIKFKLNDMSTKIFGDYTKRHIGGIVAVFIGGRMVTAPIIRSEISGGDGIITGFPTLEEAARKAELLNAGELPVQLRVVSVDKL